MICFRDMTFCTEKTCKHFGNGCHRSLTDEVKRDADMWWGKDGAPIATFVDRPECYEENHNGDRNE